MRNLCFRTLTLALGILAIVGGSSQLHGQQYVELIKFTNTWRYNQAGLNLGSTWIAPSYDDIGSPGWSGGPALLAVESSPLGGNYNEATFAPNVVPTPLSLFSGGGTNGTNIAYYFRTKFTNTLASLTGVELWATNLVDDGCVIYLNGVRVADVRLTNASPSYLTFANGGPGAEGQYDVESIPVNRLTPGQNTMAVEVHQSGIGSSDITFAMKLVAIVPSALTIASQPQNINATVGDNVAFTIGVTGGPVSYRWFRTGFPSVISTSNSLPFANVQLTNSGISYYCVITNALTPARTSSVATLTVTLDNYGPEVVSAIPVESGVTNLIQIDFDEILLGAAGGGANTNNYRVLVSGTTNQYIGVSNVQISGRSAILRVMTNNWAIGSNYYVLMNNVQDSKGNFIAPNTVVGVSWRYTAPLTQISDAWNYYDCGDPDFCDPNSSAVYANQAWAQTNFVMSPVWGTGVGIFARESGVPSFLCAGDSINTTLSFQTLPTLFRRTFQLNPSFGTSGTLRLRFIVDDGMVLFLNGQEIYRWNVAPNTSPGPPVAINSRAATNMPQAFCVTNISVAVTNLRAGMNWLAAGVLQHTTDDGDTVFGLEMDGTFLRTSPTPSLAPTNLLRVTQTRLANNQSRLSWPVSITHTSGFYGFHLLWSSNGSSGVRFPNYNQVTNQANPYTNSVGTRLFRLGKERP